MSVHAPFQPISAITISLDWVVVGVVPVVAAAVDPTAVADVSSGLVADAPAMSTTVIDREATPLVVAVTLVTLPAFAT